MTLAVPEGGIAAARRFSVDRLGFELDTYGRFEAGDTPFVDVRLAPDHVLHLRPTGAFTEPDGTNDDHVALVVEEDVGTGPAGRRRGRGDPRRAARGPGEADAGCVRDPFGYRVELTEPVESVE